MVQEKFLDALVGQTVQFTGLGDRAPRSGQMMVQPTAGSERAYYFNIAGGRTTSFEQSEVLRINIDQGTIMMGLRG